MKSESLILFFYILLQDWSWLDVKFSPNGGATDQIVTALNRTRKSIHVQAYSFTSKPIIQALIDAKKRGVDVIIILDHSNEFNDKTSGGGPCSDAGIQVLVDPKHGIAHNKIMILDENVVLTGSFNFSNSAEKNNAENSVPLTNPILVKKYMDNWITHRNHSIPWGSPAHRRIKAMIPVLEK